MTYEEGTIAQNAQGEQLIYQNGKWFPYSALSKAEEIKPQSGFTAPIRIPMPTAAVGPGAGLPEEVNTGVSPEELTDFLPGVGGGLGFALGGAVGHPLKGSAAGSAGGEAIRQLIRKLSGETWAPGVTQDALGLDPDSPEAALAGILAEGATGPIVDKLGPLLGSAAPALRKGARKSYAKALAPGADLVPEEKLMERIAPIEKELTFPWTDRSVQKHARAKADVAGEDVRAIFGVDEPVEGGYRGAAEDLRGKRADLEETHAFQIEDPETGKVIDVPAQVEQKRLHKALGKEAADLEQAQNVRELQNGEITVSDLWERRKAIGREAKSASKQAYSIRVPTRDELPIKAQALLAKQDAVRDILYAAKPEGELADAVFSGWKTVQETVGGSKISTFAPRWTLSRMIGGVMGTLAGALATVPRFWHGLGWKAKKDLAMALEMGNEPVARHVLRTAIDGFIQENPEYAEETP